ncbi:hypothetical protein Pelo_2720 [Pelomyxa schiedti]|nr:hypothetical protein Pelo_2720 [Pelomyxa schiedti]
MEIDSFDGGTGATPGANPQSGKRLGTGGGGALTTGGTAQAPQGDGVEVTASVKPKGVMTKGVLIYDGDGDGSNDFGVKCYHVHHPGDIKELFEAHFWVGFEKYSAIRVTDPDTRFPHEYIIFRRLKCGEQIPIAITLPDKLAVNIPTVDYQLATLGKIYSRKTPVDNCRIVLHILHDYNMLIRECLVFSRQYTATYRYLKEAIEGMLRHLSIKKDFLQQFQENEKKYASLHADYMKSMKELKKGSLLPSYCGFLLSGKFAFLTFPHVRMNTKRFDPTFYCDSIFDFYENWIKIYNSNLEYYDQLKVHPCPPDMPIDVKGLELAFTETSAAIHNGIKAFRLMAGLIVQYRQINLLHSHYCTSTCHDLPYYESEGNLRSHDVYHWLQPRSSESQRNINLMRTKQHPLTFYMGANDEIF